MFNKYKGNQPLYTMEDNSESDSEGKELWCICRSTDGKRFMIACDNCEDWFHGDCVKISPTKAENILKYYCPICQEKNPRLKIEFKGVPTKTVKEKKHMHRDVNDLVKLEKHKHERNRDRPDRQIILPSKLKQEELAPRSFKIDKEPKAPGGCGECLNCHRKVDCNICPNCRQKTGRCIQRICVKKQHHHHKTEKQVQPVQQVQQQKPVLAKLPMEFFAPKKESTIKPVPPQNKSQTHVSHSHYLGGGGPTTVATGPLSSGSSMSSENLPQMLKKTKRCHSPSSSDESGDITPSYRQKPIPAKKVKLTENSKLIQPRPIKVMSGSTNSPKPTSSGHSSTIGRINHSSLSKPSSHIVKPAPAKKLPPASFASDGESDDSDKYTPRPPPPVSSKSKPHISSHIDKKHNLVVSDEESYDDDFRAPRAASNDDESTMESNNTEDSEASQKLEKGKRSGKQPPYKRPKVRTATQVVVAQKGRPVVQHKRQSGPPPIIGNIDNDEHGSICSSVATRPRKTAAKKLLQAPAIIVNGTTSLLHAPTGPPPPPNEILPNCKPDECFLTSCKNRSRYGSKYCSDECGQKLASIRIKKYLPQRLRMWNERPSVATLRQEAECIHLQKQLEEMMSVLKRLEHSQAEQVRCTREGRLLHGAPHNAAMLAKLADSTATNGGQDDYNIECVTCGQSVNISKALQHMENCFQKVEGATMVFADQEEFMLGSSKLFCDYRDNNVNGYCKRLAALCDHNKDPRDEPNTVCGFPKNPNDRINDVCLLLKSKCSLHINWERISRAVIDMQRYRLLMQFEDVQNELQRLKTSISQRGNVIDLLCNVTIDHQPMRPITPPPLNFRNRIIYSADKKIDPIWI